MSYIMPKLYTNRKRIAKTRTIIIYVIMYICIIKMLLIEKKLFAKTLPVLLGFFVMGFCDIVGISSVFSKGSLWMAYNL